MSQAECVASVKDEIRRLHDRKAELALVGSKKPKLQQLPWHLWLDQQRGVILGEDIEAGHASKATCPLPR